LIKSDLHDFLINPSSWNKAVGICPIGQAKTFSTVTSSRTFARAKALLKTISGFIWDAINKLQEDVYRRLYDKFNSLSLVPLNEIK
jgi:hypothetical protein